MILKKQQIIKFVFMQNKIVVTKAKHQWWTLESWPRSQDSSRNPLLRISVSKVRLGLEDYKSRDFE